jgi:uncharacterized protein YwgA
MKRGQRFAMLLLLDREMFRQGSWCGETHLQKGTFFLQEMLKADSQYEFILYKHGPFSFELRDDLSGMQADGLLDLVARHPGYGPSYLPTADAEQFLERFPKTVERFTRPVKFVAEELGGKGVADLEPLATALFIRTRSGMTDVKDRVAELIRLKPHISETVALAATTDVNRLVMAVEELGFAPQE